MTAYYFEAPIPRKSRRRQVKDVLNGDSKWTGFHHHFLGRKTYRQRRRRHVWRGHRRKVLPFRRLRMKHHLRSKLEGPEKGKLSTIVSYLDHTSRVFWHLHRVGHKLLLIHRLPAKSHRRVFMSFEW